MPDPDIPTERSSLLPSRGTPITRPDAWRQVTLTVLATLQVAGWTATTVFKAYDLGSNDVGTFSLVVPTIALVSWVYAVLRPTIRPSCTPYYDLFTINFSHFLAACVALYEDSTTNGDIGLSFGRLSHVLNALMTLIGLVVIVNMPLELSARPEADEDVRLNIFILFTTHIYFPGDPPFARRPLHPLAVDHFYLDQPDYFSWGGSST